MVKHVYLLGAGFSVPLGGPLFRELLTIEMANTTMYQLPKGSDLESYCSEMLPNVLHEILSGHGYKAGVSINAEQILELAEGLRNGKENWFSRVLYEKFRHVLERIFPEEDNQRDRLYRFVKFRIALETSRFLTEIHHKSDRWNPYDLWYKDLTSDDFILTTNYDLVFEELTNRFVWDELKQPGLPPYQGTPRRKLLDDGPVYLKLHGSVNWHFHNLELHEFSPTSVRDLLSKDLAVGLPGVTKCDFSTSLLIEQWNEAQDLLEKADVISIIGYSLPETDNILRAKLLDCMSWNCNLQAVNIVLGPVSPQGIRAKTIIEQCLRTRGAMNELENELQPKVYLQPVYAQDFLPFYRPRKLEEIHTQVFRT